MGLYSMIIRNGSILFRQVSQVQDPLQTLLVGADKREPGVDKLHALRTTGEIADQTCISPTGALPHHAYPSIHLDIIGLTGEERLSRWM